MLGAQHTLQLILTWGGGLILTWGGGGGSHSDKGGVSF